MAQSDQDDLVQGAVEIALRRNIFDRKLSFTSAKNLIIDAYREIFRRSHKYSFPVDMDEMPELAVPANQWGDMEIKNKILSPEEQEFQDMLDEEHGFNVSREIDSRFYCDSLPLLAKEIVELCNDV